MYAIKASYWQLSCGMAIDSIVCIVADGVSEGRLAFHPKVPGRFLIDINL